MNSSRVLRLKRLGLRRTCAFIHRGVLLAGSRGVHVAATRSTSSPSVRVQVSIYGRTPGGVRTTSIGEPTIGGGIEFRREAAAGAMFDLRLQ